MESKNWRSSSAKNLEVQDCHGLELFHAADPNSVSAERKDVLAETIVLKSIYFEPKNEHEGISVIT